MAKVSKKKNVPRKKSTLSKKREEDLAKQVTKRNTQKKTIVSKTIALEPDKLAAAIVPVQPDTEGATTQSMMLRKRKTMQDKAAKMDTKRKAVISNDLADETELKEDLEDYEVAGDFLDETEEEEEDSNIDDATIKVASVIRTEQGC